MSKKITFNDVMNAKTPEDFIKNYKELKDNTENILNEKIKNIRILCDEVEAICEKNWNLI